MKAVLFFGLIVMSVLSHAGHVSQGGIKITNVFAGYPGGEVFFLTDKNPPTDLGCSQTTDSYHVFAVDPAFSDVEHVLSLLLSARAM